MCLVTHLFLPPYDSCELSVDNVGVKFTAHESGTLIVLDVALVHGAGQLDVLAEALLLEVA